MAETSDQQRQTSAPMIYSPPYTAQPNQYAIQSPATRPGRWLRFRKLMRLIIRRMLYGLVLIGRALRPHAAFAVIIAALLGVTGWMSFELWGPKSAQPAFNRAESLPPSVSIESYLQGRKAFDADMMWDAFSTEYQATQLQRGATKAILKSQADNERLLGLQYLTYDYIGGVKRDEGGSMHFYAIEVELQNQRIKLPMIFMANDDGKIESVISPLNRES